jgi:hypothetical protein
MGKSDGKSEDATATAFLRSKGLDSEASQFPCLQEYSGEHGAIETAGVGVA